MKIGVHVPYPFRLPQELTVAWSRRAIPGVEGTWIPAFAGKTRRAIGVTSNLRALRPRMLPWPTSVSMPHPRHLDTYPRHPDEKSGSTPLTSFDYLIG